MKKLICLLALITGIASFNANAQSAPKKTPSANPAVGAHTTGAPEFKFIEETHDFGKIQQGKPVTVEMWFTNIGKQPLIISAVEPTCGCTVAKYTQTPIKMGKKGSITLTYNAASPGQFNKGTTIKSNANVPVKVIYIRGEVTPTVAAPTNSK